jgi:hypothetical protein
VKIVAVLVAAVSQGFVLPGFSDSFRQLLNGLDCKAKS